MTEVLESIGRQIRANHGAMEQLALVEWYEVGGVWKVRDSLLITPTFGAIWYQDFDLGFPEIRSSSQDNPDSDGTYDTTSYHGARAVSLAVTVVDQAFEGLEHRITGFDPAWNSASHWVSTLAGWMSPARRNVRLYLARRGQDRRWMDVRPAGLTEGGYFGPGSPTRNVQLQFVNPSGRMYRYDEGPLATLDGRTRTQVLFGGTEVPGFTMPLTFPITFGGKPPGSDSVVSYGTANTPLILQVSSDVATATVDPRVTVQHLDALGAPDYPAQSIGLTGYTLPAGNFLTFDTTTKEIYLGNDRAQRLGKYLGRSEWPVLRPGYNRVTLTATSAGAGATATLIHSDAYL